MKNFFLPLIAILAAGVLNMSAENSVVPRIYGIRVMSDNADAAQSLVSFPADDPSAITEEIDLSQYLILAAACDEGIYHIIATYDGIVPSKYLQLDLATKKIREVASYDWKTDLAASLLVQDMTYDVNRRMLYTIAFDLSQAEMVEEEIEAPFGTFCIDPVSGEARLLGTQETASLVTIAADGDNGWYSIDNNGIFWNLSAQDGTPVLEILSTRIIPDAQQSMSFDTETGICYWVSSSSTGSRSATQLHTLRMNDDSEWSMTTVGTLADNSRLIGLYVDSNPTRSDAPEAIRSLVATPAPLGANEATLHWTNPTTAIDGSGLSALSVSIHRDGTPVHTTEGCTPGEEMSWTDYDVTTGMHTYHVVPSVNNVEGKPTYADEIFVGTDTPGAPETVKATKSTEGHAIAIEWTAPAMGEHGGWFDASQLTYSIIRNPGGVTLAEGLTETEYTDGDITDMHGYIYSVVPATEAGNGAAAVSNTVISGPALDIPYTMDLNDPDQVNLWTAVNSDGDDYTWYAYGQGWGGTFDTFFRYYPENILDPSLETDDWLISPAMNLQAGKLYRARYDIRLLGDLFPANTTLAFGTAPDPSRMTEVIERLDGDINVIAWTTHSVPFKVDESGEYHFGFQTRNAVPVQWYKFQVSEIARVDLAASAPSGSTLANVGVPSDYVVAVTNDGFEDVEQYTVRLTDGDGKTLASADVTETIPSQATAYISITWTPETAGMTPVFARVEADGDENDSNDAAGPLDVDVMGEGFSIDVTDGTSASGYTPFYLSYVNSAVQTIYTANELGADEGHISSLTYYIQSVSTQSELRFDAEVALANVEESSFSGSAAMIPEENFTTVFSGELTIENGQATLPIKFDDTFEYTGGNLCVYTRHHKTSPDFASVIFKARYASGDPLHSCLYRDDETPFDFTQAVSAYRDRPNASFFFIRNSGIKTTESGWAGPVMSYSRATRTLTIDGEYISCRVFSATGALLGEFSGAHIISLGQLPAGVAIIEIVTKEGTSTVKTLI